ncbi:hypothetical protein GJAV_G00114790 [Gymnothorax javanicus]|nr:hypothetical protein GJAV_G00114790 [Gymnothorax javanicus]
MDMKIQDITDMKCSVEDAFRQTIAELGGREKIHVVSDVLKSEDVSQVTVFEELLKDLFNDPLHLCRSGNMANKQKSAEFNTCNGKCAKSCCVSSENSVSLPGVDNRTARAKKTHHLQANARLNHAKVTIDSQIIIFIFRHEFVSCHGNNVRLREILKDVKARTKHASIRPALLGLVRATVEKEECKLSVVMLEGLIRSVFKKHPTDLIWVGLFVPEKADRTLTIKKNACRTLQALLNSESSESSHTQPWMQKCFPWIHGERMKQAKISDCRHQESVEELPMKTSCMQDEKSTEDQLEPDFQFGILDGNAEPSLSQH